MSLPATPWTTTTRAARASPTFPSRATKYLYPTPLILLRPILMRPWVRLSATGLASDLFTFQEMVLMLLQPGMTAMPSTRLTSLKNALEVQSPAEVIRSPATKLVCQGQRTELPQLVRIGSARTIAGITSCRRSGVGAWIWEPFCHTSWARLSCQQ